MFSQIRFCPNLITMIISVQASYEAHDRYSHRGVLESILQGKMLHIWITVTQLVDK